MDIEKKIAELADLTRVYTPEKKHLEPKIKQLLREILDQDLSLDQLLEVTGYGEVAAMCGIDLD